MLFPILPQRKTLFNIYIHFSRYTTTHIGNNFPINIDIKIQQNVSLQITYVGMGRQKNFIHMMIYQ